MTHPKYMVVTLTILICFITPQNVPAAKMSPRDSTKWLQDNYLELDAKDSPLVARAHQVFNRVNAAADKTSGKLPELLILNKSPGLYAAALPDGGIVLARKALEVCYANSNVKTGDSRLAFILGHELAHLANNDFRHLETLSEIKGFQGDSLPLKSLINLYPSNAHQMERTRKMQELDADALGIVYMTMAGYDPLAIVGSNGANFISEYIAQITGGKAYDDPSHPDPKQRADRVRSKLAAVANDVILFRVGLLYFLHGNLDKAVSYFNLFLKKFPSREVYNNIGLSHYQLAVEALSSCDKELPYRFILPVYLDNTTIADPDRSRGGAQCLSNPSFTEEIDKATRYFNTALDHDPFYLPAYLNLASAYILSGNGLKAKSTARDALKLHPESHQALMLESIGTYLDGIEDKVNIEKPVFKKFERLQTDPQYRDSSSSLYNMAMIEYELGHKDNYTKHFRDFLNKNPYGRYADMTRIILEIKTKRTFPSSQQALPKPHIPLGPLNDRTYEILNKMERRTISGELRAELYQAPGVIVIVSDQSVELVSTSQDGSVTESAFRNQFGNPKRSIKTPLGSNLIYDGFVAEVQNGRIRLFSFYEEN